LAAETFLRRPANQVHSIEEALPVIAGMRHWCETHTGLAGLAAPQLGVSLRISFVWEKGLQVVMINPDFVYQKGKVQSEEGCMSLPGRRYRVQRPKIVKVQYLDEEWMLHSLKGHDFTAHIIAHELDHLDGILIDRKGGALC
jgi:peptide deformylase